ncbi:MAG: hypothetical protein IT349_05760 [Candidatus Eisenbacteria bacterium]|nr:hypothetical protein [Candidatus Eisenbacteria bacterium]MCC7141591.1 hypothetical protein [Candidatus Eisenbacteria bacterium]
MNSATALRLLALMPEREPTLRVTPAPLLRALAQRVDLRFSPVGATIEERIERTFPDARPDWLLLPDHDQLDPLPPDLARCAIPRCVWIDDAYVAPAERARWLLAVRPALSLFTQWSWARFYRRLPLGRPLWLPHAVDPQVFHPGSTVDVTRPIDLLLFGKIDPRIYPFRARLARLLARIRGLRAEIVPHPGYGQGAQPEAALADLLRSAQVALVDGTRHHLLLRRYFEVPACGTLALGPPPVDAADRVSGLLTPLDPRESDAQLLRHLHAAVASARRHPTGRLAAARHVLREETLDARAQVLERALRARAS